MTTATTGATPAADAPLLAAIEPRTLDAFAERADAIAHGEKTSDAVKAALAIGTVPLVLGALASTAPAQTTNPVNDVLQFALLLENLESEFYKAVLGTSTVAGFNNAFATVRAKLSPNAVATLQLLSAHEIKHVALLQSLLGAAATVYDPATTFDFTGSRTQGGSANGPFYQATQDVLFLLAATQGFEDTGVRAYKGQASVLLGQQVALTTALQIHAVEARHASRIRRLRRTLDPSATAARFSGTVKGADAAAAAVGATAIPSAAASAVTAAFAAIYAGEGNTTQVVNNGTSDVTIDVSTLAGLQQGTDPTQGFDEPLGAAAVGKIVQTFIIPDIKVASTLNQ